MMKKECLLLAGVLIGGGWLFANLGDQYLWCGRSPNGSDRKRFSPTAFLAYDGKNRGIGREWATTYRCTPGSIYLLAGFLVFMSMTTWLAPSL
jgi:hypothetical protein